MGYPAEKKKPHPEAEAVDLSPDREQGLAQNFQDPGLEELISGLGSAEQDLPISIMDEAADAVSELVQELHPTSAAIPVEVAAQTQPSFEPRLGHELRLAGVASRLFELVASECSFNDLVSAALSAIAEALGAEAASVLEFHHTENSFFFRASFGGAQERLQNFRVPANGGIAGKVFAAKRAALFSDLRSDQAELKAVSALVGLETRSCVAAPLVVGQQVYGVAEFFNKHDSSEFSADDLALLEESVRMMSKVLEVRFLAAELVRLAR